MILNFPPERLYSIATFVRQGSFQGRVRNVRIANAHATCLGDQGKRA